MKLSLFKYDLPKELIAQYPPEFRDDARLMVVHKDTGDIEHRKFKDIVEYFKEDDVMVYNNSCNFPNTLFGTKNDSDIDIEIVLLRELDKSNCIWDVLVNPARKIRIGNKIQFDNVKFTAEVLDNTTSRGRVLRFLTDEYSYEEFLDALYGIGHILLPTYIDRDLEAIDIERSHAIYATDYGSILPSISGLHFTENIMCELNLKGVKLVPVTMHIGIPSTRIIDIEVLMRYKIGSEYCSITQESADILNDSSNRDRRICAVGTSTLKALEALAGYDKYAYTSAEKWAVELIYEPYVFKTADMLLTNFHLPESSQLICSSAFCGHKLLARAYDEAIKEGYALLMYGDSLLIV